MRFLLFAAAFVVTGGLAYRYRCGWTHQTMTKRDPATGAYRCTHPRCGRAYASMAESGELDSAYLRPIASTYGRDPKEGFTRAER